MELIKHCFKLGNNQQFMNIRIEGRQQKEEKEEELLSSK